MKSRFLYARWFRKLSAVRSSDQAAQPAVPLATVLVADAVQLMADVPAAVADVEACNPI